MTEEYTQEFREGYWQDKHGNWHKERRKSVDRRDAGPKHHGHDRRLQYRRRTDHNIQEDDQRHQIADALEEFAEDHDSHGTVIH